MSGLINRFTAHPGQCDTLAALTPSEVGPLPGCLSFVVAEDPTDPDALWITEVWTDQASHAASLDLPGVKAPIDIAIPLVADWGHQTETRPVGGIGLAP